MVKISIYDKDLKRLAYLENSLEVSLECKKNSISYFAFSLPENDKKNEFCKPFNFVKFDGEFYRIIPIVYNFSENGRYVYKCEHAICTLIDDILVGWTQIGSIEIYTKKVIEYILEAQNKKFWKIGRCDFEKQFEYGWQDENLLCVLFDVVKPIVDYYTFEYDFSSFPWTINLVREDQDKKAEIFAYEGKNLLSWKVSYQSDKVITRLIPRGYGEGVNQLDISKVNDGYIYLQSEEEYINKYGLHTGVIVDRRYENADTLKSYAQKVLKESQEPYVEYEAKVVFDENIKVGKKIRVKVGNDFFYFLISSVIKKYNDVETLELKLANKPKDIANAISEIADRQRIESSYAQGATQQYSFGGSDNADENVPYILPFYISENAVYINKISIKIKIGSFRAYSSTSNNNGGIFQMLYANGEGTGKGQTTEQTVQTGGGSVFVQDSTSTDYDNGMTGQKATTYAGDPSHNHWVDTAFSHVHNVSFSFELPLERQTIVIPAQDVISQVQVQSLINVPPHKHEIEPVIQFFGSPTQATVYIDNEVVGVYNDELSNIEINNAEQLMQVSGEISRGTWHEIKIQCNDKCHVSVQGYVQDFIQSRGGGNY